MRFNKYLITEAPMLTDKDKTLANAIVKWWKKNPNFASMELNKLKEQLKTLINDPSLYLSDMTKRKNLLILSQQTNIKSIAKWLANLTMAADGMRVKKISEDTDKALCEFLEVLEDIQKD